MIAIYVYIGMCIFCTNYHITYFINSGLAPIIRGFNIFTNLFIWKIIVFFIIIVITFLFLFKSL